MNKINFRKIQTVAELNSVMKKFLHCSAAEDPDNLLFELNSFEDKYQELARGVSL